MSQGLVAIAALVDRGRKSDFKALREELFLPEEAPVRAFISEYYQKHGVIPPREALTLSGIRLPETRLPFSDALARLHKRKLNIATQGTLDRLNALPRAPNLDMDGKLVDRDAAIRDLLEEYAATLRRVETELDLVPGAQQVRDAVLEMTAGSRRGNLSVMLTGWPPLDALTGGIMGGDLFLFVARRGVAKTWLLVYLLCEALKQNLRALPSKDNRAYDGVARRHESQSPG